MIDHQSAEDVQIQRQKLKIKVSAITNEIFLFIINNPYSVSETLFKLADMAMYVHGDEHDKLIDRILNHIVENSYSTPKHLIDLAFQLADAIVQLREHDRRKLEEAFKRHDPS